MEPNLLNIVCYTGGTCGDLVTAVIDPKDATLNHKLKTVIHHAQRSKLKKPHLFSSIEEKVSYISEVKPQYQSIPSHDLDFHSSHQHNFISITVEDPSIALWAAERFKNCHRPYVWEEMQKFCGATSVKDYADILIHYSNMVKSHTTKLIRLEDIVLGKLISVVEDIIDMPVSKASKIFYQSWLEIQ